MTYHSLQGLSIILGIWAFIMVLVSLKLNFKVSDLKHELALAESKREEALEKLATLRKHYTELVEQNEAKKSKYVPPPKPTTPSQTKREDLFKFDSPSELEEVPYMKPVKRNASIGGGRSTHHTETVHRDTSPDLLTTMALTHAVQSHHTPETAVYGNHSSSNHSSHNDCHHPDTSGTYDGGSASCSFD